MLGRTAALSTAVVATAALAVSTPALAVDATAGSALRVSYVAAPPRVHSARLTVVVPKLPCPKTAPRTHLAIGMSGAVTRKTGKDQWSTQVTVDCAHGVTKYRASIGAGDTGIPARPGDVVRMSETGSSEFSIEDERSGIGEGAASGSSTGPLITRVARLGIILTGHLSVPMRIVLRRMQVDHKPYGSVRHYRELSGTRHGLAIDAHAPGTSGTSGLITLRPRS